MCHITACDVSRKLKHVTPDVQQVFFFFFFSPSQAKTFYRDTPRDCEVFDGARSLRGFTAISPPELFAPDTKRPDEIMVGDTFIYVNMSRGIILKNVKSLRESRSADWWAHKLTRRALYSCWRCR